MSLKWKYNEILNLKIQDIQISDSYISENPSFVFFIKNINIFSQWNIEKINFKKNHERAKTLFINIEESDYIYNFFLKKTFKGYCSKNFLYSDIISVEPSQNLNSELWVLYKDEINMFCNEYLISNICSTKVIELIKKLGVNEINSVLF